MIRLCRECRKRPAKYLYRGRVRAANDFDICLQCFRSISESNRQKEMLMPDAPETPHIHGTPIVDAPQSVKDLFKWASDAISALEARVFALENQKPVEAPAPPTAPGTDTVQ